MQQGEHLCRKDIVVWPCRRVKVLCMGLRTLLTSPSDPRVGRRCASDWQVRRRDEGEKEWKVTRSFDRWILREESGGLFSCVTFVSIESVSG
eukprot:195517-Hanusia_phi.AAC.1